MKWTDYFWAMQGDLVMQSKLISFAWEEASDSGDAALLSNLHCNQLTPLGVCMALDAAGVRTPETIKVN